MNIAYRLAEVISQPQPPPAGGWINNMPEAFGAVDENGEVFAIGYKGEWYKPIQPTLRVRLHNWLNRVGTP